MLIVSIAALLRRVLLATMIAASLAATSTTAVTFAAPEPGARLAPVGDAADMVSLTQGETSLLFASNSSVIETITVTGWPSSDGEHDLGGAILVETVYRNVGAVTFGEPPRTVEFRISG